MLGEWMQDLESLEAISQDDGSAPALPAYGRDAAGRPPGLVPGRARRHDELDEDTKGTLSELARDEAFLLAVEDYLHRTRVLH